MPSSRRRKGRLLVVDDEENVLLTVSTILRDRGYEVDTAQGGRQAIERVAAAEYDLVLTDLSMKDCDGLEVLAAVRERTPDTVSIMLTGYASLDSALEAIRRGAYDYLTKPTNIEEMVQRIERGLEKRRLTTELRRRVDELTTLNRLANVGVDTVLRSTRDIGEALQRIAAIVAELFAPASGVIYLIAEGRGLEVKAFHASSEASRLVAMRPETRAAATEAAETGTPVRITSGGGSALVVPIEWQRKTLGALAVCDPSAREWSDENVQTAGTIASRAALAIANAELYREALEEKETLGLILNTAGDGIVGLDREGRVLFFSRAAERLLGYAEAHVRGRRLEEFGGEHPTAEKFGELLRRAGKSPVGLTSGEVVFRGAGGALVFCDVLCSELPTGERGAVQTVLALRDAKERRRLEEQKSNVISHLTHELKTPLTSILAYTYILLTAKQGPVNEKQSDALRSMRRNGQHLLTLIENMLTSAQLSQGLARFKFHPMLLSDMAKEVRDCFDPIAAERGVEFVAEVNGDAEISADKDLLMMAVNNLLSNAFRFTDRGGRVSVLLRHLGADAEIQVHDSGIGIPEEYHERIFQRYFQVDRSRGGSGLGLEIVRSVIEGHGGQIRVESRPGAGAHFYLTIPARRAAAAAPTDARTESASASASASAPTSA